MTFPFLRVEFEVTQSPYFQVGAFAVLTHLCISHRLFRGCARTSVSRDGYCNPPAIADFGEHTDSRAGFNSTDFHRDAARTNGRAYIRRRCYAAGHDPDSHALSGSDSYEVARVAFCDG